MEKVQQTIVVRRLYPGENGTTKKLPIGKYIAQSCHSSIAFLTNKWRNSTEHRIKGIRESGEYFEETIKVPRQLTDEEEIWVNEAFTKVVLCVDTEEELLEIYEKAVDAELTVHLIKDAGFTCFNGEPTLTCLCIGPHWSSKISPITKDLKLF